MARLFSYSHGDFYIEILQSWKIVDKRKVGSFVHGSLVLFGGCKESLENGHGVVKFVEEAFC